MAIESQLTAEIELSDAVLEVSGHTIQTSGNLVEMPRYMALQALMENAGRIPTWQNIQKRLPKDFI